MSQGSVEKTSKTRRKNVVQKQGFAQKLILSQGSAEKASKTRRKNAGFGTKTTFLGAGFSCKNDSFLRN